jgi:hypothetical protein
VNQRELISVHVKHRHGMVVLSRIERRSCFLHFVHDGVSPRGHAQRGVHQLAA